MIFNSYIKGPRWARSDVALKNLAHILDLKITCTREKMLLRENVRFKVEGTEQQIKKFKMHLLEMVKKYNGE